MQALVYTGPERLEMQEAPKPEAGQGEHLIKILASGICGSDMHAYLGHDARRPAPLILGHEAAGVVEGGAKDGTHVTINPLNACGTCAASLRGEDNLCENRQIISMPPREGAFAQYVVIPESNLVTMPEGVSFAKAALAEPLACGWHTVRRVRQAFMTSTPETLLVLGGGAIGFGAALCATAQGIGSVTILEPNAARRATLEAHSEFEVIGPEGLGERQFDAVIDGVGYAATRATASAHVRPGGVIGHIGLGEDTGGLDIRRMTLQEITFIGTYTYTAQDFRDTAQAIFYGKLGALDWVETRQLSDGPQAFEDIRAGRVPAPKIVLLPHPEER
ncbi:MAG: alcohol dehydrogenase catalytic domain-containing protein [Pseudomonadota bacterium]